MSQQGYISPNCKLSTDLTTAGPQRVSSIIAASKARKDSIHLTLEPELVNNPHLTIQCHRDCVTTYTSKTHIARVAKRRSVHARSRSEPPCRKRRSDVQPFEFKRHFILW